MKPIVYIDMDNVLVDFVTGITRLSKELREKYKGHLDDCPGIFALMDPMPGAMDAVAKLAPHFDLYVLSTAPWLNDMAWSDKAVWIKRYFGGGKDSVFYKRLIISHHKNLNRGAYLIDDRTKNGAAEFGGELILFGSDEFPAWPQVVEYLLSKK
jgi:5'(3')-deoxyribonucleotidase